MKRIRLQIFVAISVTLCITGCRKELCYDYDEHSLTVKTVAVAQWEQVWERNYGMNWEAEWNNGWNYAYNDLRPETGTGIRSIVYRHDGTHAEGNLPPEGGRVPMMEEGTNAILFYNNDTEYIVFNDLPSSAVASASTRTRTRGGFSGIHDGERTVVPPDMLYGCYVDGYVAEKTWDPVELPITLKPLTYAYLIRYEFQSGLQYVALARGALAGMAESVYLQDGHTGEKAATILFDCKTEAFGADVILHSFGVPNYPGDDYKRPRKAQNYTLSLEVCLKNGKTLNYAFDVTDQLNKQPRGGVIVVKNIVVSDEDGKEGSSAFNPEVSGWGDEIDIDLPIGEGNTN